MPAMPKPEDLRKVGLFQGLTDENLLWLNNRLRKTIYSAKSHVVAVEQPGEVLFIIIKGTIKINILHQDGTEVIFALLGPGDTVGELSLLDLDKTTRSANAVATEECTLLWMDRDTFRGCLETMPTFTYELVRTLCERLRRANQEKALTMLKNIHSKVAYQLLILTDYYGKQDINSHIRIPLCFTQADLASLVGASRSRVNQVIRDFKKDKSISIKKHFTTILDKESLAQLCPSYHSDQTNHKQLPPDGSLKLSIIKEM